MSQYLADPGYTYHGGAVPYGLGALTMQSDFESIAKEAAAASPANFLIVFVSPGGSTRIQTFPSSQMLLSVWDDSVFNKLGSGDAFALMVNKTAAPDFRFDQTVNPQITTRTVTRINWKGLTPWAIGGAAVVVAAIFLTRTKKRAPATRKKRKRAGWRKRVVTVWR